MLEQNELDALRSLIGKMAQPTAPKRKPARRYDCTRKPSDGGDYVVLWNGGGMIRNPKGEESCGTLLSGVEFGAGDDRISCDVFPGIAYVPAAYYDATELAPTHLLAIAVSQGLIEVSRSGDNVKHRLTEAQASSAASAAYQAKNPDVIEAAAEHVHEPHASRFRELAGAIRERLAGRTAHFSALGLSF